MAWDVFEDLVWDSVRTLDAHHAADDDRLREIVRRAGALAVPLPPGYRPTDDEVVAMDDACESWWYATVSG